MKNSGKFIDFIITQKCTYKCPYCSQSKAEVKNKKNADDKTLDSFLNLLNKIDKDFEITITGGEAMLHPKFYDLISKIKQEGFKINLITNLSFGFDEYKKVFDILGVSLNRFDISFHLDEIKDFDSAITKVRQILELKPDTTKTSFLIPLYKPDKEKERKIKIIEFVASEYNIDIDFQHIHFFENYIKNNKNTIQKKPPKTFSRLCCAGCKSAVIYENGEVYRCYSSRFLKSNYIGNINSDKFTLMSNLKPCIHNLCTCPKPEIYNQITNKKAPFRATILKLFNTIFIPYFLVKNADIVKAKLKQLKTIKNQ